MYTCTHNVKIMFKCGDQEIVYMGAILTSRRHEQTGKVIVEVLLDQTEYRNLAGEIDNVYLFTERAATIPSKVSLRGRNEATKYFLIPRQLRKKLPIQGGISCQRLDCEGRSIFIYVVDPYKSHHKIHG
jgi:hypothetical protein